ncbi:hypothetical protein AB0I22_19380 [Streptomyces sp. NPDC050610]|uniref:hypothetical protein n=1 Tax=Streptomyces sp. NPDC050610 TaxID=3157097 RepID=UPI0034349550
MYFQVVVHYSWRLTPDSEKPLLHPDAVARSLLYDAVTAVAGKYRVRQASSASDAMNRILADPVREDSRLLVEGEARVRVPRSVRAAAKVRAREEERLRLAQHRETVRLGLLTERLVDPRLGPVWWVDRYADLQFAAGDPEAKVTSVLAALQALQQTIRAAESESLPEERVRIRRKLDELFHSFDDPQTFTLAMQVVDRAIQSIGLNLSLPKNAAADADPRDREEQDGGVG